MLVAKPSWRVHESKESFFKGGFWKEWIVEKLKWVLGVDFWKVELGIGGGAVGPWGKNPCRISGETPRAQHRKLTPQSLTTWDTIPIQIEVGLVSLSKHIINYWFYSQFQLKLEYFLKMLQKQTHAPIFNNLRYYTNSNWSGILSLSKHIINYWLYSLLSFQKYINYLYQIVLQNTWRTHIFIDFLL